MRARLPVLISLCVSILAFSTACSDSANPIMGPDGPVILNSVTTVTLTPNQATLSTGSHVAMKVTSTNASGQPVPGSIQWTSSDTTVATVSASGNVLAVAPGQAVITVSVGEAHAKATVNVSKSSETGPSDSTPPASDTTTPASDTTTPPSTPSDGSGASGLWTHQPSALRTLTDQSWNSIASLGWEEYKYGHDWVRTVSDPSVPTGEASVLQFDYFKGYDGIGHGPAVVQYPLSAGEMYLGFYWKLSPNWEGHTSGVNKVLYLFQQEGDNREAVFLVAHGAPGGPYHLEISNEASDGGRWLTQNVSNVPIVPGRWYKVEMHLRKSSADAAPDGLVEWWVDGQLAARYTDAKLRGANFSEVHIDPVWGGIDKNLWKTHDDYQRFGDVHVSGR